MEQEKGNTEEKNTEDEELSIDFGKIRDVFKKKKEEPKDEKSAEKEDERVIKEEEGKEKKIKERKESEDEEISFNFDRIKGIFKKSGRGHVEKGREIPKDEELSFNIRGAFDKISKNKNIIFPVILILIAMSFGIYIRAQAMYLPIVDDWAENSVYDFFKSQIKTEVDRQYPNLPENNKVILLDKEFKKFLKENKGVVEQQISLTSDFFKEELKDGAGNTYSGDIDPYFWMRLADNVVKNGHPGDIVKDGVEWDTHMYAPIGRPVPFDMGHAYVLGYSFKVMHLFSPDLKMMTASAYLTIFIVALSIIPAFFITRRIAGDMGGFVAALLLAVHPALIARTTWGDTDAYNIFFPLFITWVFLVAFEAKNIKSRVIFSAIAAFLVGLYSLMWGGWWYIFDFLIITLAICLLYYAAIHPGGLKGGLKNFLMQPAIKNTLILLVAFFVFSAIFVTLFTNTTQFQTTWQNPLGFARMKEVAVTTIWPNVFTTVAEQNPATLKDVRHSVGFGSKNSLKFFAIAVIGIILSATRRDIYGRRDIRYVILITIWLAATMYASTKGIRFSVIVVPAFITAVGIAFGIIYEFISKWVSKELHINKMMVGSVLIAVIAFGFLATPVKGGLSIGKQDIPMMNDAWYNSLDKINREAAPDAIVNSWWDYGHWFKFIADRQVTFDGTSQNSPQAHWIGKALVTDKEDVAIGILRMLDCGANTAEENLDKIIKDDARSVEIIYDIIVMDKEGAIEELKKHGLNEEEIKSVINYTHCEPPEDYFIASDDMVEKSGVWAHFGSWNFDRAMIYFKLQSREYAEKDKAIAYLQERFNYSKEEAEGMYAKVKSLGPGGGKDVNDWIAPWPGYASGLNGCSKLTGDSIVCDIIQGGQARVNLTTMEVDIPTSQGMAHPNSISYISDKEVIEKRFSENTIGYSMALIPSGDSYNVIMMSPELAAGMFTRLYYFKGHGLEHFRPFSYERSPVGGTTVYVWKVDWKGGEKNIVSEFQKGLKEEAVAGETEENKTKS